jgi:antitoxin component YwqK of YwqJK toxin-antitoxin module
VGKVCGKGKFLSPMNIYDCSSDLTLKKYRKVIDFLFDENGDTLVSNGEGYYKGYSSNGILLKKGMISKSIEHGKWKYYDPNGNINEIGEFIYGLKDGLWLKGDLRGVDYENADCLLGSNSSNAEEEGEMIEISVINYRKGTKVSEATIKAYKN